MEKETSHSFEAEVFINLHATNDAELFTVALHSLADVIAPGTPIPGKGMIGKPFRLKAMDKPSLLMDFLSYVIEESRHKNIIYYKLVIDFLSTQYLDGILYGMETDQLKARVKSIIYPDSEVLRNPDGSWDAHIVFA